METFYTRMHSGTYTIPQARLGHLDLFSEGLLIPHVGRPFAWGQYGEVIPAGVKETMEICESLRTPLHTTKVRDWKRVGTACYLFERILEEQGYDEVKIGDSGLDLKGYSMKAMAHAWA